MSDSITEEITALLTAQLHVSYDEYAFKLIDVLESGLSSLKFEPNDTPPELTEILNLLRRSKALTHPTSHPLEGHHELSVLIAELAEKITVFQKKIDLGNAPANHFVFQAKHAFDGLQLSFIITDLAKYIEAALNPTGKKALPKDNKKTSAQIKTVIINKALQYCTKQHPAQFEENYYFLFSSAQTLVAPETKATPILKTQKKTSPLLWTSTLKKDIPLDNLAVNAILKHSTEALNEKIHNLAYDSYYKQVAMYMDMHHDMDEAYQLTKSMPDLKNTSRKKLFESYNIEQLNHKEQIHFLDEVAKKLGFKSSIDLYLNYTRLLKEDIDAEGNFKKIKENFMSTSLNTLGHKEEDPLSNLADLYTKEHARLQEKIKRSKKLNIDFYHPNYAYLEGINYAHSSLMPTINTMRVVKNVVSTLESDLITEQRDKAKAQNNTPSVLGDFLKPVTLGIGNYAMNYLNPVEKAVSGILQHAVLLEEHLNNTQKNIKKDLALLRNKKKDLLTSQRKQYFKEMLDGATPKGNIIEAFAHSLLETNQSKNLEQHYIKDFDIASSVQMLKLNSVDVLTNALKKVQDSLNDKKDEKTEKQRLLRLKATKKKSNFKKFKKRVEKAALIFTPTKAKTAAQLKAEKENQRLINLNQTEGQIIALKNQEAKIKRQLELHAKTDNLENNRLIQEFGALIAKIEKIEKIEKTVNLDISPESLEEYYSIFNAIILTQNILSEKKESLTIFDLTLWDTHNKKLKIFLNNEPLKSLIPLVDPIDPRNNAYQIQNNLYAKKMRHHYQAMHLDVYKKKFEALDLSVDINNIDHQLEEFLTPPKELKASSLTLYFDYIQEQIISKLYNPQLKLNNDDIVEKLELIYDQINKLQLNHSHLRHFYEDMLVRIDSEIKKNPHSHSPVYLTNHSQATLKIYRQLTHARAEHEKAESWISNLTGVLNKKEAKDEVIKQKTLLKSSLERNLVIAQNFQVPPNYVHKNHITFEIARLDALRAMDLKALEPLDTQMQHLQTNIIQAHETILRSIFSQKTDTDKIGILQDILEPIHDSSLKWLLLNIDLPVSTLPDNLVDKLLDYSVTQHSTNISAYQPPGMIQKWVADKDGAILKKIRAAFILQEKLQLELNNSLSSSDALFAEKQKRIIVLRENLVTKLKKNDTPVRIEAGITKWNKEITELTTNGTKPKIR